MQQKDSAAARSAVRASRPSTAPAAASVRLLHVAPSPAPFGRMVAVGGVGDTCEGSQPTRKDGERRRNAVETHGKAVHHIRKGSVDDI